jgi:hypothetical protein
MQLEEIYIAEIIKLQVYKDHKENPLIQIVRQHQHTTNSAMLHTARSLRRELQRGTRQVKESIAQNTKGGWCGKRMHVQFPHKLDKKNWWIKTVISMAEVWRRQGRNRKH